MVKLLRQSAKSTLELAKIDHHVFFGSLRTKVCLPDVSHDTPAMAMEIFAFAMVICQKMSAVKATFRFKPIHNAPRYTIVCLLQALQAHRREGTPPSSWE